jgi:hypothetical protein
MGGPRRQARNVEQTEQQCRLVLPTVNMRSAAAKVPARSRQRNQGVGRRLNRSLDPHADAWRTRADERLRFVAEPLCSRAMRRLVNKHRGKVEGENGPESHPDFLC